MNEATLTLEPVDGDDLAYVETVLERNDLPADDVRSKPAAFSLAVVDGDTVGVGGVEVHGTAGLLRSVVVERSARGEGIGTVLCDRLEDRAADRDVETLYLLTTTAADFFAGRGYVETARADVPPAIRETREFADLCPSTATCMAKALPDRH